jgi:hypothetical protein
VSVPIFGVALAVAGAGVGLLGPACAPDRTMLVVRIDSDLAIPDAMDSVRVVVTHAGKTLQSLPFSLKAGTNTLPLQVGLLSPSGGGADVEVQVSGSLGPTFVVGQEAITSFVRGKSVVLEMFLAAECEGFDCHDPNKTCTKGQLCVDKTRVAGTLPPFDPHPTRDAAAAGAGGAGGDAADGPRRGPNDGTGGGTAGSVEAGPARDGPADRGVEAAPELRPGCVPTVEDCFNGIDDDCDGLSDCADPDCALIAVCVPRPSGNVGAIVGATDACPKGFAATNNNATPFGLTIDGGGTTCGGCQCAQATSATSCSATLTTYPSTADCQAGTNGKNVGTISSGGPGPCPVPDTSTANVFGAALSPWTVSSSACGPSGTPTRPTATFATSAGFCPAATLAASTLDNGCAAGAVCMRRPAAGMACVLLADASACPTGTKPSGILYAGIQDNRSCAACTCTVQGASCDNLVVQMGSDYGCGLDTADLRGGARTCTTTQPTSGVYVPGYHLTGTPTSGACRPLSALSGTATPTAGRALCCLP